MADRRKVGRRCVAGAPNKTSCGNDFYTEGITMHRFPIDPTVRAKWIRFVKRHRVDFNDPGKNTWLCSAHFEKTCFNLQIEGDFNLQRRLHRGSIPTRDTVVPNTEPAVLTERNKRQIRYLTSSFGRHVRV